MCQECLEQKIFTRFQKDTDEGAIWRVGLAEERGGVGWVEPSGFLALKIGGQTIGGCSDVEPRLKKKKKEKHNW